MHGHRSVTRTYFSFAALIALSAACVWACGDDDDNSGRIGGIDAGGSTSGTNGTSSGTSGTPQGDGGVQSESEVLRVMAVANQGEIDQGNAAQPNAVHANVKAFASKMVTDHGQALTRGQTLATQLGLTPADSEVSQKLQTESAAIVTQLQGLTGEQVDRVYIQSQVTVHTKVLALIDSSLLPTATDATLKAELTTMRGHVASHLEEARQLAEGIDAGM